MTDSGISGATASLPSLTGRVLDGRYRMDALVGAGGMGVVYAGWHIKLEKRVAIKLLDPRFADRPDAVKRFLREARSASKISHRNVVEVMDFGQDDDLVYFVMEFLEGADLSAVIRRSAPLPWPRAKRILVQIVRALKAAHTQGIVHRDIKPANCFVVKTPDDEPDVVKVLDFGIAKVVDPGAHTDGLTSTSQVIGTALYMAPEQAMGKPIDARTDVYALGTMAFEMVSGRKPFVGATGFEVLMKRVNEPPPSILEHISTVDAGVDAMIRCAMARDPDERFQSMRSFEEALVALPGDADAGDDAHVPLLTDADLGEADDGAGLRLETVDSVPRSAPPGTPTMTAKRLADATPVGASSLARLSSPVSGPEDATEVGPPLPDRSLRPAGAVKPSEVSTVSAPVSETVARVFEARAAEADDAAAESSSAWRWWPAMAVALLGLVAAGVWLSRTNGTPVPSARSSALETERPVAPSATDPSHKPPAADAAPSGSATVPEAQPGPNPVAVAEPEPTPSPEPTTTPPAPAVTPVVDAEAQRSPAAKKKKKSGRKPKPPATRASALTALGRRAKKSCDAPSGTKVVLDVFVSATGTFSTPRDRGSTAGADAVACVIGVVKGASIPSGPSELRRVNVSF